MKQASSSSEEEYDLLVHSVDTEAAMITTEDSRDVAELADRGDVVEARRRNALIDFGIDPTDWPLSILRDEPIAIEAHQANPPKMEVLPLSDEAWILIADIFPKPHRNQKLSWRETIDALIILTQTGRAWIKLGKHAEAIRARLHRSRPEQWDEIEQRINGSAIDGTERQRISTLCTFASRYLAERDGRENTAPTPTAVQRLLTS